MPKISKKVGGFDPVNDLIEGDKVKKSSWSLDVYNFDKYKITDNGKFALITPEKDGQQEIILASMLTKSMRQAKPHMGGKRKTRKNKKSLKTKRSKKSGKTIKSKNKSTK